ncbi:HNH endonuclease signature motif containing protein [Nocardioides sp. Kera G14]|uniref:HNH endonuclease signature motif containing protein n=1 Tax=Nocardioides sp. Kera G14 TaxID=2884264 RepID=UPI001D0F5077|nr:HNH endonuclease signature motif containing protein [Nocardioides sp. Kera G14]UDY22583.1 HNH endonuclease [Nocardioides sp. Kera G14]
MALSAPAQQALTALTGLQGLAGVCWSELPEEDLPAAAAALAQAKAVIEGALVAVAHELELTDAAAKHGWASAKDFLTAQLGGYKGSGGGLVRLAEQTKLLPRLREALSAGEVSLSQARVIAQSVAKLPRPAEDLRAAAVEAMLARAEQFDATDLEKQFDDVLTEIDFDDTLHAYDLDLPIRERAAHQARFLSFSTDRFGGVKIKGYGSPEEAELIKAVLMPLAAPVTTEPGACGGDPALVGKRDADGHRLEHAGGCPDPVCAHDGRDPRDSGARMWDALLDACTRLRATDSLPHAHGTNARIFVTTDLDTLRQQLADHDEQAQQRAATEEAATTAGFRTPPRGERPATAPKTATLADGIPLSATAVRRLACDAEIIPGVLGTNGQILDVGRAHRLVTTAIWLALVLRDRHCAFPGCNRLPIACDAHHIVHWADGGSTSLDNLILLCRRHHTMTHHTSWTVSIDPETRQPVWQPPPRVDDRERYTWLPPGSRPLHPAA